MRSFIGLALAVPALLSGAAAQPMARGHDSGPPIPFNGKGIIRVVHEGKYDGCLNQHAQWTQSDCHEFYGAIQPSEDLELYTDDSESNQCGVVRTNLGCTGETNLPHVALVWTHGANLAWKKNPSPDQTVFHAAGVPGPNGASDISSKAGKPAEGPPGTFDPKKRFNEPVLLVWKRSADQN